MQDDELAAVIAALQVYAQQQQPREEISKWQLTARDEAVAPFDTLRVTGRV